MIGTGIQAECNVSHAAELAEPSHCADPVTEWTPWMGASPPSVGVSLNASALLLFLWVTWCHEGGARARALTPAARR